VRHPITGLIFLISGMQPMLPQTTMTNISKSFAIIRNILIILSIFTFSQAAMPTTGILRN